MQARLESNRFPSVLVAILFALTIALLLAGTLGYMLKPATAVSGPTHTIVVPASQSSSATTGDPCEFIDHSKAC